MKCLDILHSLQSYPRFLSPHWTFDLISFSPSQPFPVLGYWIFSNRARIMRMDELVLSLFLFFLSDFHSLTSFYVSFAASLKITPHIFTKLTKRKSGPLCPDRPKRHQYWSKRDEQDCQKSCLFSESSISVHPFYLWVSFLSEWKLRTLVHLKLQKIKRFLTE